MLSASRSIFAMQASCSLFGYRDDAGPQEATTFFHNHNPATPYPNSRPNLGRQYVRDTTQEGMGMTKEDDRRAQEREEIAARVARFKATQDKFKREREEFFFTTLENARHTENSRRELESLPFWS